MEFYKRIAAYLQQYVSQADNSPLIPPEPDLLKDAIRLLLENKIVTVQELRREALEQFNVIVPWYMFPEDVQKEVLRGNVQ